MFLKRIPIAKESKPKQAVKKFRASAQPPPSAAVHFEETLLNVCGLGFQIMLMFRG